MKRRPGNSPEHLHADAVRLDREAALHERAALSLGEDEARGHAGAVAEDRDLAAVLEAIDDQVMRRRAEWAFDDTSVAAALFQVRTLDLEHLRPPLRMAVRVAHQLPDALHRRLDERLLGARPLHARSPSYSGCRASSEMLVTPYLRTALSARSDTKRYSRVLPPRDDFEAGSLDRLSVAVALHRPADARRPERRVAGDALGQLLGRDDVGQCQPSAGPQRVRDGGEDGGLVRREVDHSVRDHAVDALGLHGRLLDIAAAEFGVLNAGLGREACRFGELLVGHVDADHTTVGAACERGEETVHAGAAAEVEHRVAWGDVRQVEEVPYAGERVDRGRWYPVEIRGWVAEPFGQGAARLEVEFALRLERNLLVHLLDALFELLCIERSCGGRAHGDSLSGWDQVSACSASCHSGQPPSSRRAERPSARSVRTASWAYAQNAPRQ